MLLVIIISIVTTFFLIILYLNYEPSIRNKLIYVDGTAISANYVDDLVLFFENSDIYTNQEIKSVLIEDIGIGNCSNIENRQRFRLNLEGYVASTISLIFIENNNGILKHCSSVNPLSKVDIVID